MNKNITAALEIILVIVFLFLIALLFFIDNSTALVWTVVIPLLPILFLIIGFSNWRNICPLAYFSKVSQKISFFRKRKVPVWFENNFYFFQYFLLFTAFSLRLTVLNFDTTLLGVFFVFVILSAFLTNLIFTGKSWCNFFCPVGVVEKIYCLSNSHKYDTSSACSTCTACKVNCPDIDMESNYWKENLNKQKTFVFYSFAGLVLGFYVYFYLQTGSFENYFSGNWTNEYLSLSSAGFFFAPAVPLFIAAPVTLVVFTLLSYFFFKGLEQFLWHKIIFVEISYETLVHRMKVVSSFVAFNIFYVFAGAPSYMNYPSLYAIFYFFVVLISGITLYKEFFREESFFIQERIALKMISMWDTDKPIPTNLKEIYYTYVNDTKAKKEKLKAYKDTVSELLYEGILTKDSMALLEKLRGQMGISLKDHTYVINSLKINNEDLFDSSIEKSSEQIYQRASYKKMLEESLVKHEELSPSFIESLQEQFYITNEIHKEIMDEILNTNEKLQEDMMNLLKQMNLLRRAHKSILNDKSYEIQFLKYIIKNEFDFVAKEFFVLLDLIYKDDIEGIKLVKKIFRYTNIGRKITLDVDALSFMDEKIVKSILSVKKDFDNLKHVKAISDNKPVIKYLIEMDSLYIPVAALLVARNYDKQFFEKINIDKFLLSDDSDTVALAKKIFEYGEEITTYEEMMYLYNVPLFEGIKFNELKILAQSTELLKFKKDQYIIRQGEVGDKLYIIIEGFAQVNTDGKLGNKLGEADYFGAISLLGDITRTVSVKAYTDISVLTLSKESFKDFIYDNPKVSIKLIKEIIHRLIENKESDFINEEIE